MWIFAVERGPAIAFWLLALAAQISGFTNIAIALVLVGVAAFFLVAPTWHHIEAWRKALGMGTAQIILLVGILGTWLFMTVGLGAAAWMVWSGQGFAIGS
jgi:hypothetical protein